ncbi:protein RRP5 homolog [Pseudophryne corroboree]|uniref:protein RRP5 homolog n=1 Tax=Pseudophryne corroboree TaxID=495146 RepID=UPI003081B752
MEESFPRGGTQKKSDDTVAKKRPRQDDNLFSMHHEEVEEEIKKKKKRDFQDKPTPFKPDKSSATKEKPLHLLNYKDLSVGMLFLGCVKEVTDFELVVSLPYGLTGYVQATNICEAYTNLLNEQVEKDDPLEALSPLSSLYSPGMLVRCTISNLGTTSSGLNSIKLSLNPKLVNVALAPASLRTGMLVSGCLSSVEDHGYLIDIGVGGTKAFLPLQKAEVYLNQIGKGAALRVGQYLNCVIEEVKIDGRIVRLSITQSDVAAAMATVEQQWTLNNLLPGLVVKAEIQKVLTDHITVSFLSSYAGVVDFLHFEPTKSNLYKKDQEVKACILWIDRSSKTIRLTLRKCFLQPGNPVKQLSSDWIGTVHDTCTVKKLHRTVGAVFQLDGNTMGFAFKCNLSISKHSDGLDKFKVGSVHSGRVVGFSPMDETLLLSFKGKVVKGLYLRHEDIEAGQILEGTVDSFESLGMVVNITEHLNGLVPNLHLADITLHQPQKKYILGNKIKCRVLNVVPSAKKLILTRKKTMLNSKLPIIRSYQDAKPGLVTHGFIWAVKDFGCLVRFYNDVQGLAPVRELSSEYIPSPEEAFYMGQVVKVRVLECSHEKGTMLLSFKMIDEDEGGAVPKNQHVKSDATTHPPGKIVDVKIVNKTDKGLTTAILPEESHAFLPKNHLSDYITNCELLWHCLKEGDTLTGAMCLSSFRGKKLLTKKPALISFMESGTCVKDFSDVQVGMLLTGFVKNIMPYGLFVEFPYGLVGLVPKSEVSDRFVTNVNDYFVEGQTVVAKVTNTDEEKKRFLLTLKLSECAPDDRSAESLLHLRQCVGELRLSKSLISRGENTEDSENLFSLLPGKMLTLVVDEVEKDGSVLFSSGGISGSKKISAAAHHDAAKNLVSGQKVKAVVLYVDIVKCHVHVSVKNILLKKRKVEFEEDSKHSAVVQHVAEDLAVVSLGATAQLAAVPLACHYNDTFRFDSEKLHLGETISVTLKTSNAEEHGLLLAVQNTSGTGRQSKAATFVKRNPAIGEVVTGTVKSVKPTSVTVSIADKVVGTIHASQIMDEVPMGLFPTSKLHPKETVTCRVIGGREIKTHRFLPISHPHLAKSMLELSILPSLLNTNEKIPKHKTLKMYSPGEKVTCYVVKYNKEKRYLEVEISPEIHGRVRLLLLSISTKVVKHPEKHFKQGQALSATVVGHDVTNKFLFLSLTDVYTLADGCVTLGRVKKITRAEGLCIGLPFGKTGKAGLPDLGDCYAQAPVKIFKIGMFVRCCILSASTPIKVSLRKSRTNPGSNIKVIDKEISSIDSLQKGQLLSGFIDAITDKGVFLRLSSSIVGKIQFQNVTDYHTEDQETYKTYLPKGKLLSAKVIYIKKEAKPHVSLSLLSKDTGKLDVFPKSANLPLRENKGDKKRMRKESESEQQNTKKRIKKTQEPKDDEDSGVEVHGPEDKTKYNEKSNKKDVAGGKPPVSRLQVSSGFSWDVDLNTLKTSITVKKESSSDSEEDEAEEHSKTKKNKKRKGLKKKQGAKEATDPDQPPRSVTEFERLVLGSPNSSVNWIQYMEFHLQATELEQARAVAERALETIYFREEQEKLNVWVAMLNMENTFGTEETLQKLFQRAVQYNDPLKAFQHLADIYIKSEKFKEADTLFNTMVKRFRQEKSVWWKYASFLMKQGQSEATHRLLQRALRSLPDKEHVDVISKFAQLEFHMGDAARAIALFESTLSSYPKRTDVWSVYIDMMVKHGSQKEVRDIFERVIHLSMAAKKIKFFFKRYLEYEKKHGDERTIQAVKEKALEYVESKSSMSAT